MAGKERFPDLRLVQFGGDTRYKDDVELWKKSFSTSCILSSSFSAGETGFLSDYLIDYQTDIAGNEYLWDILLRIRKFSCSMMQGGRLV